MDVGNPSPGIGHGSDINSAEDAENILISAPGLCYFALCLFYYHLCDRQCHNLYIQEDPRVSIC
jgi:hypothetical protein